MKHYSTTSIGRIRIVIRHGDTYYRASVTPEWAEDHNNYRLVSCGLTVGEDGFTAHMLGYLKRKGQLTKISHEAYNHFGCQSSCVLRGAKECRW